MIPGATVIQQAGTRCGWKPPASAVGFWSDRSLRGKVLSYYCLNPVKNPRLVFPCLSAVFSETVGPYCMKPVECMMFGETSVDVTSLSTVHL